MVNHFRRMTEINIANTFKNLREAISSYQLARLKKEYEPLRKVDMSKHKGQIEKTTAMLSKLKMGTLIDLSKEDIPVISDVAKSLVKKDKRFAHHVEGWKDELKNQGNVRVGKTDSQGNWHSVSTSDKKEIEKLKRQGYKVVDEEAPANATGTAVAGTGDDSSTVVVKKKKPLQDKLMRRLKIKEAIDRAVPDLEYPKDEITERKQQLIDLAKKYGENI